MPGGSSGKGGGTRSGREAADPPEDAPLGRNRLELPLQVRHAFRAAEDQKAAFAQGIMKHRHHPLLGLMVQIDQQVPAANQVQAGEGRIADHVVRGKDHALPDLLADPVVRPLLDEEPPQPLGRHVGGDGLGIDAGPGLFQGMFVDVGGKDLNLPVRGLGLDLLQEQDGQRIGLLAGRTAGNPHPQRRVRPPRGNQFRQHLFGHDLPGIRVAEEVGDADHQVAGQGVQLGRVVAEHLHVLHRLLHLPQAHATPDAAAQRGLLIAAEVVADPLVHQRQHFLEEIGRPCGRRGAAASAAT